MNVSDAVKAISSARLCLEALLLIDPEDYREPCFQVLLCQTLGRLAEELGDAHATLEGCVAKGRKEGT